MTTKERKTVQNFINRITELENVKQEAFDNLQNLCWVYGDGSKWCSPEVNYQSVLNNCEDASIINRAKMNLRRYFEADAQIDIIRDLGGELANIGFWK